MKKQTRDNWRYEGKFVCSGCGEKFRYINNLTKHLKHCWDYKLSDGKQED